MNFLSSLFQRLPQPAPQHTAGPAMGQMPPGVPGTPNPLIAPPPMQPANLASTMAGGTGVPDSSADLSSKMGAEPGGFAGPAAGGTPAPPMTPVNAPAPPQASPVQAPSQQEMAHNAADYKNNLQNQMMLRMGGGNMLRM